MEVSKESGEGQSLQPLLGSLPANPGSVRKEEEFSRWRQGQEKSGLVKMKEVLKLFPGSRG